MSLAETVAFAPKTESVMACLREGTAAAHKALESDLDIDARIHDPAAMRRLLERFWGFHAAWEPVIAGALSDDAFLAPRRKLALLRADLLELGLGAEDISALARPTIAPIAGQSAAMGSLYVLEGSTLGGQVISRMLAKAGWSRPLRYFNPYGPDTGAHWRAFRERAEAVGHADTMLSSANETFRALRRWLPGGRAA